MGTVGIAGRPRLPMMPQAHAPETQIHEQTIDLHQYGWQYPEKSIPFEMDPTRSGAHILYSSDGSIIIGFAIRTSSGLATREAPPMAYRVVRLTDALKLAGRIDFPTNNWYRNFIGKTATDRLLVSANDSLAVLSLELVPIRSLSAIGDIGISHPKDWRMLQSPSHKTALLYDIRQPESYEVFDTDDLKPIADCPSFALDIEAIDDRKAMRLTSEVSGGHAIAIIHTWNLCLNSSKSELARGGPVGRLSAVSDETYVQAGGDAIRAISSTGRTLWQTKAKKHLQFDSYDIRSNQSGDRFAIAVVELAGGNQALDISAHVKRRRVAVFDSQTGLLLSECGAKEANPRVFDYALNQDGTQLAVLADSELKICNLSPGALGSRPSFGRAGGPGNHR